MLTIYFNRLPAIHTIGKLVHCMLCFTVMPDFLTSFLKGFY